MDHFNWVTHLPELACEFNANLMRIQQDMDARRPKKTQSFFNLPSPVGTERDTQSAFETSKSFLRKPRSQKTKKANQHENN